MASSHPQPQHTMYAPYEEGNVHTMTMSQTVDSTQPSATLPNPMQGLTQQEILQLRQMLSLQQQRRHQQSLDAPHPSSNSIGNETPESAGVDDEDEVVRDEESLYHEFPETTHAWAIFADDPRKLGASKLDRAIGVLIISFQIFTYSLFAAEAIEDYQKGAVPVLTQHADCWKYDMKPQQDFLMCEAQFTNWMDALVAFFMLGIFLSADVIQAARAIKDAPTARNLAFSAMAGLEVVCAYLAACVTISYHLYIGEVTDAVEVGVGLLFIRELSARAYHGIRQKKHHYNQLLHRKRHSMQAASTHGAMAMTPPRMPVEPTTFWASELAQTNAGTSGSNVLVHQRPPKKSKQYIAFFGVLALLVVTGLVMNRLCEFLFAASTVAQR